MHLFAENQKKNKIEKKGDLNHVIRNVFMKEVFL